MNIYEQVASNKRTTWILVVTFIIFFLLIGFGLDYYYGAGIGMPIFTFIAVLFGCISSYSGYYYGDRLILSSTHAEELDLSDHKQKQWQNVIDEMAIASGIPAPKTYLINDSDPNAFATGRNPENSSIAVTKGLLDTLNRDELQAVAAHEMSHIRNFDIRLMLMIAVLVGAIALISDWASRMLYFRGNRRDDNDRKSEGAVALIALFIWIITVIIAPLLSQMMAMFVSRKREYLADASGAELTRNPLALANALEKIDANPEPTRLISKGTAHLCIADPSGRALGLQENWFADLFSTHPPINKRIEALKQMAYA